MAWFTFDPTKRLIDGELVIPDMVCFCDIPPDSLDTHMRKYGRCGLSLDRNHLLRHDARPVAYYPYDSRRMPLPWYDDQLLLMEAQYKLFRKEVLRMSILNSEDVYGELSVDWKGTYAVLAATQHTMGRELFAFLKPFDAALSEDDPNNFYMEREWRRLGNMCFEPEHVGHIIVPLQFVAALRRDFPEFADKIVDTDSHANPPR